jgi:hypothetical protein
MLCQIVYDQKQQWDNVAVVVSAAMSLLLIPINGANASGDKASADASADALRTRHITTG